MLSRLKKKIKLAQEEGYNYVAFNTTPHKVKPFLKYIDNKKLWNRNIGKSKRQIEDMERPYLFAIDVRRVNLDEFYSIPVFTGTTLEKSTSTILLVNMGDLMGGTFYI